MSEEATARPWTQHNAEGTIVGVDHLPSDDDGGFVAEFASEFDAELAVCAVNSHDAMRSALLAVVDALRDYLPPDGIDAQECLNRILEATDNPTINPIIRGLENGR